MITIFNSTPQISMHCTHPLNATHRQLGSHFAVQHCPSFWLAGVNQPSQSLCRNGKCNVDRDCSCFLLMLEMILDITVEHSGLLWSPRDFPFWKLDVGGGGKQVSCKTSPSCAWEQHFLELNYNHTPSNHEHRLWGFTVAFYYKWGKKDKHVFSD